MLKLDITFLSDIPCTINLLQKQQSKDQELKWNHSVLEKTTVFFVIQQIFADNENSAFLKVQFDFI